MPRTDKNNNSSRQPQTSANVSGGSSNPTQSADYQSTSGGAFQSLSNTNPQAAAPGQAGNAYNNGWGGVQNAGAPGRTVTSNTPPSPGVGSYYPGSGYQSPALASSGIQSALTSRSNSGYQSPAVQSSGVQSAHISPSNTSYRSTPLPDSGVPSHGGSLGRGAYTSPALQSSGVLSPQPYDHGRPNNARQGVTQARGNPSGVPQPAQPLFGGAFPSNPQHRHSGSNPFPNANDPQYELQPRARSGDYSAYGKSSGKSLRR
ncbi:hypothetical protein GY45DRAFT_429076 [Cubamyces sp. BRFM 1775]|nr:hypothetical protein GY45DRAFT_429076 [Cubamyces sp. BRFM 1775]